MASSKISKSNDFDNLSVNNLNLSQEKKTLINPFKESLLAEYINWDNFLENNPNIGYWFYYPIPATFENYNLYLRVSPILNSTVDGTDNLWTIHYTLTIEEKNTDDMVRGAVGSSIRGEIVDFVSVENIDNYINNLKQNKISLHFLITGQKGHFKNANELVLNPETIEIS